MRPRLAFQQSSNRPRTTDLRSVSSAFSCPRRLYAVAWALTDRDRFAVTVTVPAGGSVSLILPDGSREVLCSGEWHRQIPAPDRLIHPFSLDTPNLDIVRHPAAAECLRTILPRAWAMVTGESREFLTQNGHFLLSLPMFSVTPAQASSYRAAIEGVRPWGSAPNPCLNLS